MPRLCSLKTLLFVAIGLTIVSVSYITSTILGQVSLEYSSSLYVLSLSEETSKHVIPTNQSILSSPSQSTQTSTTPDIERSFDTLSDECLTLNSLTWKQGPRLGNADRGGDDANTSSRLLTTAFVQHTVVDFAAVFASLEQNQDFFGSVTDEASLSYLLAQTLSFEQSRFRNWSMNDTNDKEESTIRMWSLRLVYLATFYHQNRHAIPEAKSRFEADHTCQDRLASQGIGLYDYECPNAKFLVTSLANVGLGANIRGGAVYALLAGLASDRVVLFVNDAPVGHKYLRMPWELVSCPRNDYQCFFLPPSPCVLTEHDLQTAYSMTSADNRKLLKQGQFPKGHQDDKVWHMTIAFTPIDIPSAAAERLKLYSHALIQHYLPSTLNQTILRKAADALVEKDAPRPGYNYANANVKIHHALVLFSMRPNFKYQPQIQEIVSPQAIQNIPPERSIGLPIRASDKCKAESECLSFGDHMRAVSALLEKDPVTWPRDRSKGSIEPTVIFTSESQAMVQEQQAFAAVDDTVSASLPFRFRFAVNTADVTPDTGFVAHATEDETNDFSAEESLLSAVTSLKFQLLPRLSIGNCCSNFHVLLADLLASGCGAAPQNTFHCMQENEDPTLKICCGWWKDCKEEKRLEIERRTNNATKT